MRCEPTPEVSATVAEDGELVLSSAEAGEVWYAPDATAIWVALRQHGGDPEAAANRLAEVWEVKPVRVFSWIMDLVWEWCDAGVMKAAPGGDQDDGFAHGLSTADTHGA